MLTVQPDMSLEFYPFGVVMRRNTEHGSTAYAIDPTELSAIMAQNVIVDTGLLPEGSLYYARVGAQIKIIEYRAPQVTAIWLEGSEDPLRIPLPGLVMIRVSQGDHHEYRLFAVKHRPSKPEDKLYRAPLPNTSTEGICWGTVKRGKDASKSASLEDDWVQLLGSRFGNHDVSRKSKSHEKDIRAKFTDMEKRKTKKYPLTDLIETKYTMQSLMKARIE